MADLIDVRFPDEQQEGTKATIAQWLVKPGDKVAAHDPVVEIETDKVVLEVAAPEAGRIADIKIPEDGAVGPGDVLCTIDTSADKATTDETNAGKASASNARTDKITENDKQKKPGGRQATHRPEAAIDESDNAPQKVDSSRPGHADAGKRQNVPQTGLSPAVRQRVMQHDLDLAGVTGSGRNGRITLQDVERLIAEPARQAFRPSAKGVGSDIIPHSKMRKRIAEHMVASLMHTAPHVTAVFEADLSAIMKHRSEHKAAYAERNTPLTLTVYFIAAAIAALQKVPSINSRWFDDHLEVFHAINIGIGTALGDKGLIVPVLHNTETMSLKGIAKALNDVTGRARSNQLKPQDVRGGTFTISNHGVSGSLIATPVIINQPQSAILGIGKIEKRVKVCSVDGEDVIAIRPMCYLSLTIDHRVIDGHQANTFLTELVSTLENWC